VAYNDGFKCNIGSIRHDYPALNRWLRMLYWDEDDSFRKWTNFTHVIVLVIGLTVRLRRDITPVRQGVQVAWFLPGQNQILYLDKRTLLNFLGGPIEKGGDFLVNIAPQELQPCNRVMKCSLDTRSLIENTTRQCLLLFI
jgi:hypothetical protein